MPNSVLKTKFPLLCIYDPLHCACPWSNYLLVVIKISEFYRVKLRVPVVVNLDIIIGLYFETLSQSLGTKVYCLITLPNSMLQN